MSDSISNSKSQYTGSTSSTFANTDKFVNFQQKFNHFNPNTPNPHYNVIEHAEPHLTCECRFDDRRSDQNHNTLYCATDHKKQVTGPHNSENRAVASNLYSENQDSNDLQPRHIHLCDRTQLPIERQLENNLCPSLSSCNSNIHIHYNISYAVPTTAPSVVQHDMFYSDLVQNRGIHSNSDCDTFVCDV